jgi:GNAT superfamily N-acetyltransferase
MRIKVTYLEMFARPQRVVPPPREGLAVVHARRPTVAYYRFHFGLMPEFIGQGLGRYFLRWAIGRAWSYGPRRFWLHTDTKDHPAALPNYLKAGFDIYKEEVQDQG